MQKHQENVTNFKIFKKYYEYNFKKNITFNPKYIKIKDHFNIIKNENYNFIIFKLFVWYKIKRIFQIPNSTQRIEKKKLSKRIYKNEYFQKIHENLCFYFKKTKSRFLVKKNDSKNRFFKDHYTINKLIEKQNMEDINKENYKVISKLKVKKSWFFFKTKKNILKIPKWKFDRLYFFKKFFFSFPLQKNIKKPSFSKILLTDYTLRTKFKTSVNFENTKTFYGIIHIKPSGANIFITLTNYTGNVFRLFLLVFLMKFVGCSKVFKRSAKTARPRSGI